MMRTLSGDMNDLVDTCSRDIPGVFESDEYTHRIEDVMKEVGEKRQAMTDELEREARKEGFTLQSTTAGITPVSVSDGKAMTQEDFALLPDEQREEYRQRAEQIQHSITHTLAEIRRLSKEAAERTKEVDTELVRFTLTPIVDELQTKYEEHRDIVDYLDLVEADMVDHLDIFKPREESAQASSAPPGFFQEDDPFVRYRVNNLVDNAVCEGAPVIFEMSPTYYNLFGRIEYRARVGALTTDLMMIKPGAVHMANGGYLVIQARDLLISPLSWDALKRSLRSGEVRIENTGEQYSPLPSSTLRPQPIPIDANIILVGSAEILRALQVGDEDFRRYFKVTADFDILMDRTVENMAKYAAFVAARCRDAGLRPFHSTAVARIVDYSSRLVEDQDKLTTRFMDVSDIMTEASYWAKKSNSDVTMGDHVQKAIDQRRYRGGLTEDRILELIESDTIRIATEGTATGQVNGLAVYTTGEHSFGRPSRISARVSLGRGQVVNVERETQMSGKIHNKGFMILTGYIHGQYASDKPLSLSASIGFEQTYGEVDGDSASSTELYALLSALSELGIDQGIAVTGSVNQSGEVQAIGGAIQKIEGFYEVCKAKGLTGTQGVMIPKDNLRNLVLEDEVIEAVKEGRFHIYQASTIDEGIEILTGVPAGERREDGTFPEGTVHYLVETRLEEMRKRARQLSRDGDSSDRDHKNGDDSNGENAEEKP